MREIRVFYHLFMVNHWQRVFEWHLEKLQTSGLFEICRQVHVGVVYENPRTLAVLDSIVQRYEKTSVCFSRALAEPPVVWHDPEIRLTDGRLGAAETVLHMTEYAQRRDPDTYYLFFHSKGVTNPPTKQRRRLSYFVSRGFDPSESNEKANDFVLEDTSRVVSNWAEYVQALETCGFWYYIYNFFWITGRLLHQFDFDEYILRHRDLAPPHQRSHRLGADWNTTRHMFSLFPIKLHAFVNGIEMEEPSQSYCDVKL